MSLSEVCCIYSIRVNDIFPCDQWEETNRTCETPAQWLQAIIMVSSFDCYDRSLYGSPYTWQQQYLMEDTFIRGRGPLNPLCSSAWLLFFVCVCLLSLFGVMIITSPTGLLSPYKNIYWRTYYICLYIRNEPRQCAAAARFWPSRYYYYYY